MLKGPIRIKRLSEHAVIPTYGTEFSAGADLYACITESITLAPGETRLIHTGLAMEIPVGYAGLVYARSSLAVKRGLAPANKVSVIDSDYRGELMIPLHNHSSIDQTIEPAERIAQIIFTPYYSACFEETEALDDTARGTGGFGSTGKY
ncbi:MAG: dUTP diphosphatase [Lachnospiraceae bacterium]|nr:dUTP diphosphatase [Lachnospiraceae bacterium]